MPLPILVALLAGLAACTNLPLYSNVDHAAAMQILSQRAAAIRTLSARCDMTMTAGDGQAMRLDAVLVIAPPDRMRLRAWKMGQAVFDLTLRPGELWIESANAQADRPATARLAKELGWFSGGFFTEPGLADDGQSDGTLIFRRKLDDGSAMLCEVEGRTVTPRRYRLINATGVTRFTMEMTDYQNFNGIVWPTHLTATSARDGRIELSLSDLQFNQELPPGAFVPPPNAEKQP